MRKIAQYLYTYILYVPYKSLTIVYLECGDISLRMLYRSNIDFLIYFSINLRIIVSFIYYSLI